MHAYRVPITEGCHTQVVKVCVEPRSMCAGFVLADLSCLLLPLSLPITSRPTPIPAPCSDACFVRLETSILGGGGSILSTPGLPIEKVSSGGVIGSEGELSFPYSKAGETDGATGDVLSVAAAKVAYGDGLRGKGGKFGGNGSRDGVTGSVKSRVFFLTAQSGKGGSCIDLHAWLCEPPYFTRAKIGLNPGKSFTASTDTTLDTRQRSRTGEWQAARLEVPHGMAMKIVASVNVVIVYSIAIGKTWIMAAKYVGVGDLAAVSDNGVQSNSGNGFSKGEESEREFAERSKRLAGSESPGRLLLMKCAVVDVSRPAYSLHVSVQHLLFGQSGGVWIWPLRPLIKPDKRQKDRERSQDVNRLQTQNAPGLDGPDLRLRDPISIVPQGRIRAVRSISSDESDYNPNKGEYHCGEDQRAVSTGFVGPKEPRTPRYGLHETEADDKERERKRPLGMLTRQVGRTNGVSSKDAGMGLGIVEIKGYEYHFLAGAKETETQWEEIGQEKGKMSEAVGKRQGEGLPQASQESMEGLFSRITCGSNDYVNPDVMESLRRPSRFSSIAKEDADQLGKSAFIESLSKSGFMKRRNSVVSNGSSVGPSALSEKSHGPVKSSHYSGLLGPFFVPFAKENGTEDIVADNGDSQAQVVDIQEMSWRRFVVLDSSGLLHLLALDDLQQDRTSTHVRTSHPRMDPLCFSMRVKSMAVLIPAVRKKSVEPNSVTRRLWISDGYHGNCIVSISGDGAVVVDSTDLRADARHPTGIPLKVSQTVFTRDRVYALAAIPPETVLVVTQGGIVAYVLSES